MAFSKKNYNTYSLLTPPPSAYYSEYHIELNLTYLIFVEISDGPRKHKYTIELFNYSTIFITYKNVVDFRNFCRFVNV